MNTGTDPEQIDSQTRPIAGATRRRVLGAAASSFALAASGLFLPRQLQQADAREGALDGEKGGRRGNDNKGRHKKRTHGDKKENNRNESRPPQGHGPFRTIALTVHQSRNAAVQWTYTFYYRQKTGLDEYGPWIESSTTVTPDILGTHRYAPDRYRIGVLLQGRHHSAGVMPEQAFIDVRNVSFGYPLGSEHTGTQLNPVQNKIGSVLIAERDFAQPRDWFGDHDAANGRWNTAARGDVFLWLHRMNDSDDFVEFELYTDA